MFNGLNDQADGLRRMMSGQKTDIWSLISVVEPLQDEHGVVGNILTGIRKEGMRAVRMSDHLDPVTTLATGKIADGNFLVHARSDVDSVMNAYAVIKRIQGSFGSRQILLLLSGKKKVEADKAFSDIANTARQYLDLDIEYAGFVQESNFVEKANTIKQVIAKAAHRPSQENMNRIRDRLHQASSVVSAYS